MMFKKEFIGIQDFKGKDVHEGDVIQWPNQDELGVVRYEPSGCQFRIQFDSQAYTTPCHVGLQMGKKGRAIVIGSVYDAECAGLVPWAVINT